MNADQVRTQGKEELFEAAAIPDALAQERNQFLGNVHATAAFVLGEGENPGRVLIASGAGAIHTLWGLACTRAKGA